MDNLQNVELRQFAPEDVAAVRQLIHSAIDACYVGIYPPMAVKRFKDFHSDAAIRQRACEGYTVVAVRDGALCGAGTLLKGHITAVYVQPSLQRQGLGTAVMRRLEERARADGLAEVTLHASLPSKTFYESIGYHLAEEESVEVGNGEQLRYHKASKRLTT